MSEGQLRPAEQPEPAGQPESGDQLVPAEQPEPAGQPESGDQPVSADQPVPTGQPGSVDQPGHESWRPVRETKSQRQWTPGQVKQTRSIRVTFTSSVLVMEALVLVFFGLALFGIHRGEPMGPWLLGLSVALAAVAVLNCALVRRPVGIWIGWGIQVLLLLGAFLDYTMLIVGIGFGLAWWYAVTKGGQIDRENRERAVAEAQWRADHPDAG